MILAAQVTWSESMEALLVEAEKQSSPAISGNPGECLRPALDTIEATLNVLADSVLHEQTPLTRKKLEHLVSSPVCPLILIYQ